MCEKKIIGESKFSSHLKEVFSYIPNPCVFSENKKQISYVQRYHSDNKDVPILKITWIREGVLTSKEAEALKEKDATGLVSVVALIIVFVLELISCDIFSTVKNGVEPTAKRGKSSENDVYLFTQNYQNIKFLKQLSNHSSQSQYRNYHFPCFIQFLASQECKLLIECKSY